MPAKDANHWNSRYQSDSRFLSNSPRTLLIEHADLLPSKGLALDIAMGLGGNASFLIQRSIRVIGVDISYIAVSRAKNKFPELQATVADLEQFRIPQNKFDVILNFMYLQRNLWMPITNGLKTGGVLFIECLTAEMLSIHPEINPTYLLKPTELQKTFMSGEYFSKLKVLYYSEGWCAKTTSHARATARLIARRIA